MTGRPRMRFGYRGVMSNYRSIIAFHWEVAPVSTGKVRMAHGASGTNCVDAKSKNSEAPISLLCFIASTKGQLYRTGIQGAGMPSRTSVLNSPDYLRSKAPRATSTGLDTVWKDELAAGHARTVPGTPKWAEIKTALTKELSYLPDGSKSGDFHVGPSCSPIPAGLYTGHYANSTGVWHTVGGRSQLRWGERLLAAYLSDAGYATAQFGK